MLGLDAAGLARQSRAARHHFIETSAAFLLRKVTFQLGTHLAEGLDDMGARRVPIWPATRDDVGPGRPQQPMEAAVFGDQVIDITAAVIIAMHGFFLFRSRLSPVLGRSP